MEPEVYNYIYYLCVMSNFTMYNYIYYLCVMSNFTIYISIKNILKDANSEFGMKVEKRD